MIPKAGFSSMRLAAAACSVWAGIPTAMSRLLAGAAQGLDFAEPIAVRGAGRIGDRKPGG